MASLSRNGLGYSVSNRRIFDAWGSLRLGAQTGDPTGRYCANLGHKQDDESGLVYMRARYYEPTSGRFVSEDPAKDGWNWFIYCGNDPIGKVDASGQTPRTSMFWSLFGVFSGVAGMLALLEGSLRVLMCRVSSAIILLTGAAFLVSWFNMEGHRVGDAGDRTTFFAGVLFMATCGSALAAAISAGKSGIAGEAISAVAAYVVVIGLFMALDSVEGEVCNYYASK